MNSENVSIYGHHCDQFSFLFRILIAKECKHIPICITGSETEIPAGQNFRHGHIYKIQFGYDCMDFDKAYKWLKVV